jgi:predicted nucleic acid-binding protein
MHSGSSVTFLFDTSTVSAAMRDEPRLLSHIASLAATDRLVICSIVRGEILHGIERLAMGRRRQALEVKATRVFASIVCEPVTADAATWYAAVKAARERAGLALDENDLWIAATALSLGAVLVSRDSDFRQIAGLAVEDWTL